MAYKRIETADGVTVMSAELYNNLQDGIDEALKSKAPNVTQSDNGKFMCVINGKWEATTIQDIEEVEFNV